MNFKNDIISVGHSSFTRTRRTNER